MISFFDANSAATRYVNRSYNQHAQEHKQITNGDITMKWASIPS